MGYKKDIFGIFAYEFELLPKNLEFSNLVCGGEPPSVDQWLHHFETAYKNHRDLFLGIYRYAFEQLSYDLLIKLHRSVLQPVQDGVYIVESGLGLLSLELTISDVAELLLQTSFFIHESFGFFFIEGIHRIGGYFCEHFFELCIDFRYSDLQFHAVVLGLFGLQAHSDVYFKSLQHTEVLLCRFHDCSHDGSLQDAFLYSR